MAGPEQTRQALAIFKRALNCEPAERAAFLDSACAGDVELRAVVEAMLRADEVGGEEHRQGDDTALAEASQLIEALAEIVGRVLQHDEDGGYASLAELREELRRLLRDLPIDTRPPRG